MMPGWIQVKQPDGTSKLIPKEEYHGNNVRGPTSNFIPDIEPFVSPIDGSVITTRPQLKQHMKNHGVTHSQDYSPEFLERKTNERIARQKREGREQRIETIRRHLEK